MHIHGTIGNDEHMSTETQIKHETENNEPKAVPINSGKISNGGFIVSKWYDIIWFIGAPSLALLVAVIFLNSSLTEITITTQSDRGFGVIDIFIGTFIMSHLFIVFFRSHGNSNIFALHPVRFVAIPILLIVSMTYSIWILVTVSVIAIWWDVYHSAQQTFGLGRIYDMRIGNDAQAGRRLDHLLNTIIYLGPILAGASLMDHVYYFQEFQMLGVQSIGTDLPSYIFNHRSALTKIVLVIGIPFILYYLYAYWQLYKQGYVFSINKVILMATTAFVSIFCWGFNTFGEAYFVMNFFHAWQYFAIVWAFEKKNITQLFGLSGVKNGQYFGLFIFVFIAIAYGLWATIHNNHTQFIHSLILTVSILHFWYDGFIWSVRKKQV